MASRNVHILLKVSILRYLISFLATPGSFAEETDGAWFLPEMREFITIQDTQPFRGGGAL
jgi:hypothetical protein